MATVTRLTFCGSAIFDGQKMASDVLHYGNNFFGDVLCSEGSFEGLEWQ